MGLKEKIEEHWLPMSVGLVILAVSCTYGVLEVTVIEPLRQSNKSEGLQTTDITRSDLDSHQLKVRAAGSLIVQCHDKLPKMLGVLHNEGGRFVFSPPAGKSNENESPEATAIRETKEETGYSIRVTRFLGNAPKGNTNFSILLGEIDEEKGASSYFNEVVGLLWSDPARIPEMSWRFPEQRDWVIELFEQNSQSVCAQ